MRPEFDQNSTRTRIAVAENAPNAPGDPAPQPPGGTTGAAANPKQNGGGENFDQKANPPLGDFMNQATAQNVGAFNVGVLGAINV